MRTAQQLAILSNFVHTENEIGKIRQMLHDRRNGQMKHIELSPDRRSDVLSAIMRELYGRIWEIRRISFKERDDGDSIDRTRDRDSGTKLVAHIKSHRFYPNLLSGARKIDFPLDWTETDTLRSYHSQLIELDHVVEVTLNDANAKLLAMSLESIKAKPAYARPWSKLEVLSARVTIDDGVLLKG